MNDIFDTMASIVLFVMFVLSIFGAQHLFFEGSQDRIDFHRDCLEELIIEKYEDKDTTFLRLETPSNSIYGNYKFKLLKDSKIVWRDVLQSELEYCKNRNIIFISKQGVDE